MCEKHLSRFPTLEEPRSVEVDALKLHELVVKEDGSISLEPNETRKEVDILSEMILWEEMHGRLENKKMTPIL